MWIFGPPDIAKMKAKKDVKGLIKALLYEKNPKISNSAAIALGEIGDSSALAPLVEFLVSVDPKYAHTAASALGLIGDNRAIEPLISFIKREEADAKYSLSTSNKNIEYACKALGKICTASIEPLITLFASIDNHYRPYVIKAIGETGSPEALDWLITTMDDHRALKVHIIKALGRSGQRNTIEPLKIALKDRNEDVHEAAAWALEKLGWEPDRDEAGAYYWVAKHNWEKAIDLSSLAIEPLITVMWDDGNDKVLRQAAADALGVIGTQSIEPVIYAIANPDEYWYRGRGYKKGMGNVWNHNDMRPSTLDHCIEMIVKIGTPAIEPLLIAIKKYPSRGIRSDAEFLEQFIPHSDRRNMRVHQFALDALGKIGDSRAVNPLIAILEDKNTYGRDLAAQALGKIGDLRAVDSLIAILRDKEEDVPVAHAARWALKELGWKPD